MKDNRKQDWIVVIAAIMFPTFITWIYFVLYDGESALIGGAGKLIQFGFPVAWIFLIKRMSLKEAGLPETETPTAPWSRKASLALGFGAGVAIVAAMWGYYRFAITREASMELIAEIDDRVEKLSLDNVLGYAVLGVFYSLIHSFLEEYYFRWFVFGRLRHLIRFTPAAIISGLAFMAHHVIVLEEFFGHSIHTYFLSASIAVGGFIWAWQYEKSRSLLGSWMSHLVVDAGIFLVGYHMLFVVLPALER